jgi:hypothetical protein
MSDDTVATPAITPAGLMPAAFFGHGNSMNALEVNRYTPAPGQPSVSPYLTLAILVISAHWYINATAVTAVTAVTAMPKPRTIHDCFGFPQPLFDVEYPAPGLPALAAEISDVVHPTWVGADIDSWGIDHGTWPVLVHAFPDASIPVVQLSVNAAKPFDYHPSSARSSLRCVSAASTSSPARAATWRTRATGPTASTRPPRSDSSPTPPNSPACTPTRTSTWRSRPRSLHPRALPRRPRAPGTPTSSSTATPTGPCR